jgi:hypothetical protein
MASPPSRTGLSAPAAAPYDGAAGYARGALLGDEPVSRREADLLGAWTAAEQLATLLVDSRASTPFTLAVDAGWGMGKSSLMRMVDARLRQHGEVHTVWYNAWSSTGTDALEGLIKSVLGQFDRNVLRRALRRAREGGALVRAAQLLSLLVAGPLGAGRLVDELWRSLSVDATARNGMRDALRRLVDEWTRNVPSGTPDRMLVVFIDDLDRCSQPTVLALCEALKVYLDVPGLAFVIGCDKAAISPDGLLRNLDPAGAAFMEKIFQTSYRIPAAGSAEIHGYVRWCAAQAGLDHLLDERLVQLLAERAARNPRRVKRLVNGLLLEARLNPIWADIRLEAVIGTLLVQYLYSDFYRLMTTPGGSRPGTDVVHEFLGYLDVRGRLRGTGPWTEQTTREVERFLSPYAVPVPDVQGRPDALANLEGQLPEVFPQLADDPSFVALLGELMGLSEIATVLRRLRYGMDGPAAGGSPWTGGAQAQVTGPPDYATGYPTGYPAGYAAGPALPGPRGAAPAGTAGGRPQTVASGLDDLDGPDGRDARDPGPYPLYPPPGGLPQQGGPRAGGSTVQAPTVVLAGFTGAAAGQLDFALQQAGLAVDFAFNDVVWQAALRRGPQAVLCHTGAFTERDHGFELVRAARAGGYHGPVVFYTPRLTPNERRAAEELVAAAITDDTESAVAAVVAAVGPVTPAAAAGPRPYGDSDGAGFSAGPRSGSTGGQGSGPRPDGPAPS